MRTNYHPHTHTHSHHHHSLRLHWQSQFAKENMPAPANLPEPQQTKSRIQGMSLRQERTQSPRRCELEGEYLRNQGKIERLSNKLQQLYEHFQEQSGRLEVGKRRRDQLVRVQDQNWQLEEDIRKVRELLQGSLLEEEIARLPRQFSELQ